MKLECVIERKEFANILEEKLYIEGMYSIGYKLITVLAPHSPYAYVYTYYWMQIVPDPEKSY